FPLEQITKSFKGTNRTLIFSDEEIESLLYSEYGKGFTFSVLSILYPSLDFRNYFHMDHIHPKSKFKKNILLKNEVPEQDISSFLENYNYLANLQFLEANPNLEKSDKFFEDWFNELPKEERNEYRKKHYIPKEDLCISNFLEFFEEREKLIEKKLKKLLQF
ncbi:MAG: hypothetical protein KAJ75_06165, partial [Alphaproteobacteria bacterium]|nr:hypothetical protein [Alphaproteobacteria bacterium]